MLWSIVISCLPIIGISFVLLISVYKIYFRIRSLFRTKVNCWFCNQNSKVPYLERNSWNCPFCEQYNGFSKDGDYNRVMTEHFDGSHSSHQYTKRFHDPGILSTANSMPQNGLCTTCNEFQRQKVERLSQFQPKYEWRFDKELKQFKAQLEQQFPLCGSCSKHVKRVLRDKKKMVLGLKFLDFIMKGTADMLLNARSLKRSMIGQIFYPLRRLRPGFRWKEHIQFFIIVISLINIFMASSSLPALERETITSLLGERIGGHLFIFGCHILAFLRTLNSCLGVLFKNMMNWKLFLFIRAIFIMVLFSIGIRLPDRNLSDLFLEHVCPFVMLALSLLYNALDGFHFGRSTFLLGVWSVYAGQYYNTTTMAINSHLLKFILSVITFCLMCWSTPSNSMNNSLRNQSSNSFHKIYSREEDYDDDTISLLSQEYSGNPSPSVSTFSASLFTMNCNNNNGYGSSNGRFSPRSTNSPALSIQRPLNFLSSNNFPSFSRASTMFDAPFQSSSPLPEPKTTIQPYNYQQSYQFPHRKCSMRVANGCQSSLTDLRSPLSRSNTAGVGFQAFQPLTSSINRNLFNQQQQQPQSPSTLRSFSTMNGSESLRSTFSASTSVLNNGYQQQYQYPQSNLLRPTRFSTFNLNSPKWFGEDRNGVNTSNVNNLNPIRTNVTVGGVEDTYSLASSQSSGFESQNGRLNRSRENSCDNVALLESNHNQNSMDQTLKTTTTVENTPGRITPTGPSWHIAATSSFLNPRRSALNSVCANNNILSFENSFNLKAITEELPNVCTETNNLQQKEWKEVSAVS